MSKAHWDKSFSEIDYVYGETANKFILSKHTLFPANAKIACFAEGEGRNAVFLARQGHHVTAFDQSPVGLDKTKSLAHTYNVQVDTFEMDLTKEKPRENQFDASIMVFGHVPKQDQAFFIFNLANTVKPEGYILFEVYSEDQLLYNTGGPPTIEMLYSPQDILSWIKPYKCLHFYYGEAERYEGKKHNGKCHIIQAVIQKVK